MTLAIFLQDELLRGLASVPRAHRVEVLLLPHNFFSAVSLKSRSVLAENFGREWNRSLAALIEVVGVSGMKKGAYFLRIRKDHTHFLKCGPFHCNQKWKCFQSLPNLSTPAQVAQGCLDCAYGLSTYPGIQVIRLTLKLLPYRYIFTGDPWVCSNQPERKNGS